MNEQLFKINLQLFGEEEIEAPEIEEENEGIELEVENEEEINEETDTEDSDDDGRKADDDEEKANEKDDVQVEKTVPLKALEAERKKWQERLNDPKLKKAMVLADKLASATGKDYDSILAELDKVEIEKHVDAGMSPEIAQVYVAQQRELAEIKKSINKQKYDIEVAQLKQNSFYSDIDDVRDSVEEYAVTKGISLKEAYNALYADSKVANMETAIEQRILNNIAKKQGKKVDTTSNGTVKVQSNVKLSPEQKAIAKMAGMTDQEYYNMLHTSNVEQYQKLKK